MNQHDHKPDSQISHASGADDPESKKHNKPLKSESWTNCSEVQTQSKPTEYSPTATVEQVFMRQKQRQANQQFCISSETNRFTDSKRRKGISDEYQQLSLELQIDSNECSPAVTVEQAFMRQKQQVGTRSCPSLVLRSLAGRTLRDRTQPAEVLSLAGCVLAMCRNRNKPS